MVLEAMKQDPTKLRIPGPTPLPPQVIAALSQPVVPHRGPELTPLFIELREQLARIHGTSGEVFVIAGTGSTGWEASIVNTLSPGDKVLAAVNGGFGERFVAVAERFGMDVIRLDFEWGAPVDPEAVRRTLAENPGVKVVQVVHNETSTGVLNPIDKIGPIVREHAALFITDSVSGAGGAPLRMDEWQIDIAFTGSQKAFMCPPGLSIIAVGERVWPYTETASIPRFILDLERMREAAERGSTPSTAPVNLLYALKAACDMIEAEGLDDVMARHERLAAQTRAGLQSLGVELLAEPGYFSPTVTVAVMPEGVSSLDVQQLMRERHGIEIATGTGPGAMRERVIRIGHMGWTHEPEMERTLAALDDVLEHVPARQAVAD
jgi:aspartate aminotransferase-like enzyme